MGRRVTAHAAVATRCDADGRTRLSRLRSDGPLALRESGGAIYLVGAAAGPLGGDEFVLDIDVGPGSVLTLRQSAATLVLPGRDGAQSRSVVRATVGAGATLVYSPEPMIAAAGCAHRAESTLSIADGGAVVWREQLALGRHAETSGRITARLDASYAGRPILRNELRIGESDVDASSAVLDGAAAVGSTLVAGSEVTVDKDLADDGPEGTVAIFRLAGPGVLVTATATDAGRLTALLVGAESHLRSAG